jgi:plasmid stability protein
MKQLTIRALDDDLETALRQAAAEHHTSLNRAALMLLRRGAGLTSEAPGRDRIGNRLDRYIGSWTAEETAAFEDAIAPLRRVDPDLWR